MPSNIPLCMYRRLQGFHFSPLKVGLKLRQMRRRQGAVDENPRLSGLLNMTKRCARCRLNSSGLARGGAERRVYDIEASSIGGSRGGPLGKLNRNPSACRLWSAETAKAGLRWR